jgi:hypothetical protein
MGDGPVSPAIGDSIDWEGGGDGMDVLMPLVIAIDVFEGRCYRRGEVD